MTDDRPTLGSLGQVYVTLRAARDYAAARGLREEEARREITEQILEARLTAEAVGDRPATFRRRSRTTGVDITARVVREGQLLLVVAVSVRSVPPRWD
jgi:hypothetical protein